MKGAGIDPASRPTTGQDAELAAIQRILTGEQYLTVYKAIKPEAEQAAELAVERPAASSAWPHWARPTGQREPRLTWAAGQVAGGWVRWVDRRGGADPTTAPGPRRRRRPRRRPPARS